MSGRAFTNIYLLHIILLSKQRTTQAPTAVAPLWSLLESAKMKTGIKAIRYKHFYPYLINWGFKGMKKCTFLPMEAEWIFYTQSLP